MCALRLSVKALRASKFERSTQPVKYRIESHIACEIAATIESQSLADVRHRSYRNTDRNQNRSPNRFSMCATVAIGTQIESRIEQPIASRCAPPWPSEPNRFPMCATVAIGTQIETRIDHPIAARRAPPWPWEPSSKPESSGKSHANSNRKSTPKSIQNRCKINPGSVKMIPRSGPGAPRRPRRVPGGSSRASWDALGGPCGAPGGSLGAS